MAMLENIKKKLREGKIKKFATSPEQRTMSSLPGTRSSYERFKEKERIKTEKKAILKQKFKSRLDKLREPPRYASRVTRAIRRPAGKKFSKRQIRLVRAVTGQRIKLPSTRGTSRSGGRVGRPRGPSGKYFIPGKGPVGVYQWRKWASRQRAMRSLQQSQQYQQQRYVQQPQQQVRQMPQQIQQVQQIPQQQLQQMQQPQQQLIQTGWDILKMRIPSPSQSQPINPFKQSNMFNVERPVTNPNGEYYTEPDLISGRQVLKRRVIDKSFRN